MWTVIVLYHTCVCGVEKGYRKVPAVRLSQRNRKFMYDMNMRWLC